MMTAWKIVELAVVAASAGNVGQCRQGRRL